MCSYTHQKLHWGGSGGQTSEWGCLPLEHPWALVGLSDVWVCLSVHVLQAKRLELSTPKLVFNAWPLALYRHVLTLRSKGQMMVWIVQLWLELGFAWVTGVGPQLLLGHRHTHTHTHRLLCLNHFGNSTCHKVKRSIQVQFRYSLRQLAPHVYRRMCN